MCTTEQPQLEEEKSGVPANQTRRQSERSTPVDDRDLRIELEIVRGGPCVMDTIDGEIVDIDIRFENGDCRCDIGVQEETSDGPRTCTKQFTSDICRHCPGIVFSAYGCIPRYLEVNDGSFVMETYVEDTDTVASLVRDIRKRCKRVTVRSLCSTSRQEYPQQSVVDLSPLTPKQREAVHYAQEYGYYDPDSKVQLQDLAARLDISLSALSQRLQRAEANVLRQLSCDCSCWRTDD